MSTSSLQEIIGCFGHPIAGNPTQFILERAFHDAGVDARCLTVDVAPERLAGAIEGMRAMSFRGGVVAVPHNEPVCKLLDDLTATANFLGRADSIFRNEDGLYVGDHTLGAAIEAMLPASLAGKSAVVCGVGPEAQSICCALAKSSLERLTVAGTSADKGEDLVCRLREFAQPELDFQRTSHNVDFEPQADFVIFAGPLEPTPDDVIDPIPIFSRMESQATAIDLPYRKPRTAFLESAAAYGCQVFSGVDVMVSRVNQAFRSWTDREADAPSLREAVEEFFMI